MEEDIKILEELLNTQKKYIDDKDYQKEHNINKEAIDFTKKWAKAIENLIARYKELEEENKKYPIKMNDEQYNKTIENAQKELRDELERQIYAREINEKFIETNYISKSRVKEKIEEIFKILDKIPQVIIELNGNVMLVKHEIADVIQELLEDFSETGNHIPRID